ncbi:MAG: glycosyltransferase family 61 protein [Bacteroidota bacterium]|nr:glycosyltransferase family 61 protein [Bacteroidota bacterium]
MKTFLLDKSIALRKLPVNYEIKHKIFFEQDFKKEINETYISEFKNVLVTSEGIAYNKFHIIKESLLTPEHYKIFNLRYLLSTLIKGKGISLTNEEYLLPFNFWYKGYFHWITETLPRLYIIKEKLREYVLLLPEDLCKFHLDSIAPFNFKNIFLIPGKNYVKIENLILPSHTAPTGNYNEFLINKVREFYLDFFKTNISIKTSKRIYISRAKAARRQIENEEQVKTLLKNKGFDIIYFEELTFAEQLLISNNADIMLGLHGAGLTNMLFMKPGTNVFELRFENDSHNLCYFSLASALNLNYYYQFCNTAEKGMDTHTGNINVDLEALEKNIDLIIK